MKWTGIGVFSHEGKDYFPGDDLPKEAFSLDEDGGERLDRLRKEGAIDGRLSGEQYEAAQARVEENRKKSEGKESAGHKAGKSGGQRTKKHILAEAEKLQKGLAKLKIGKDDDEIKKIESRLEELEIEFSEAAE